MCGHVGIISHGIMQRERKIFEELLYADALRGFDATGVALGYKPYLAGSPVEIHSCKRAVAAMDFLALGAYDNMMHNFAHTSKFVMGHNRWATRGEVTHKNSHPFTHGKITLAHNGSLTTQVGLPDHTKFEVDSENIAYSIDKVGVQETVDNLSGSYSLVWFDEDKQTLNFLRNAQRPMVIAKVKGSQTYIYASEGGMLGWIAHRNNIVLEESFVTDVNTLYSFDLTDPKFAMTTERAAPVYKPPKVQKKRKDHQKGGYRNDVDLVLGEVDLKVGQRVEFSIFETKVWNRSGLLKFGLISGVMLDDPWLDVQISNVEITDDMLYDSRYSATIKTAFFKGNVLTILLDPNSLDDVPDDEDAAESAEAVIDGKKGDNVVPFEKKKEILTLDKVFVEDSEDDKDAGFPDQSDDEDDEKMVTGPGGKNIPVERFEELTKHGCSNCTGDIVVSDHAVIEWISGDSPVCPDCVEDPSRWSGATTIH